MTEWMGEGKKNQNTRKPDETFFFSVTVIFTKLLKSNHYTGVTVYKSFFL